MSEMECKTCLYESTIEALKNDADRNSEQHREFYGKFNELNTALAINSERYTNVLAGINELKTAVNELKEKPAKRWDNVVMTIISCLATGVVAFILARVGM